MTIPRRAEARWQIAGRSVRGASHEQSGLPNQDAVALWASDAAQAQDAAVAAVADGHGGSRHFRSETGARIAVDVTVRQLRTLAAEIERAAQPMELARAAERQLPSRIVSAWIAAARTHLEREPISDAEWQALAEAEGDEALASVKSDPLLAYGATLLAALATRNCIVLIQLGDGDVLAVQPDGSTRRPVPADARLAGNLTTSLCRPEAEDDFRSIVLPMDEGAPALLLLSTDGYANSFRTDDDFLKVGTDFLGLIDKHGMAAVKEQLGDILVDASKQGSGDDITVALIEHGARAPSTAKAAMVPASDTEARQALRLAQQHIGRLRATVGALSVALCVLAGWTWRSDLDRLFRHDPALAAEPLAPTGPVARKPEPHEPPAVVLPKKPGEGVKDDVAVAVDAGAGGGVAGGVAIGTAGGAADGAGSGGGARIDKAHAQRGERGVEVSFGLSAMTVSTEGCSARAAVWNEEHELATATTVLGPAVAPAHAAALKLLVRYPAEKATAKAMKQASATFSIRVDCGGQTLVKAERLTIES